MQRGNWYTFRSTLDKLTDHLNSIESDGDEVVKVEHVGGRDWVILCRKTPLADGKKYVAGEHGLVPIS